MPVDTYLNWVIENTKTAWWHDSAEDAELDRGLARGAVGVTTNPFLSNLAVCKNRTLWETEVRSVCRQGLSAELKAEALMRIAVTNAARKLTPEFERTRGAAGWVCAQVNPLRAGDRDCMYAMAQRFHQWAPNIAVKLPATSAGLDVLEECAAEGITTTATVSFTVPQVLAIAEKHRRGIARAQQNQVGAGKCFAVIMIGRLDDYLRDVAHDNQVPVSEADIQQAGLAVTKRAYSLYRERGYDATLLIAALRGPYHLTELTGAELLMSIAPQYQEIFVGQDHPREERIDRCIPGAVIDRLRQMPEFIRAYEPDGMTPEEFISYGPTQRTLTQFADAGWKLLEAFQ